MRYTGQSVMGLTVSSGVGKQLLDPEIGCGLGKAIKILKRSAIGRSPVYSFPFVARIYR